MRERGRNGLLGRVFMTLFAMGDVALSSMLHAQRARSVRRGEVKLQQSAERNYRERERRRQSCRLRHGCFSDRSNGTFEPTIEVVYALI